MAAFAIEALVRAVPLAIVAVRALRQTLKHDADAPSGGRPGNIEILNYLTGLAESEANRAWTRQTVLLSINTALIGIATLILSVGSFALVVLPAILGLTTTYVWQRMNRLAEFYQARWYADIDALIRSDHSLEEWVKGWANPRVRRPFGARGYYYFGFTPWVFLFLWTCLGVAGVVGLFFEPVAFALQAFGR
jgi:hypothetical protein